MIILTLSEYWNSSSQYLSAACLHAVVLSEFSEMSGFPDAASFARASAATSVCSKATALRRLCQFKATQDSGREAHL